MIRRTTPRTTARGLSSILAAVALGFLVAGCSPSQTNEGARETPEAIAGAGGSPAGPALAGSVTMNGSATVLPVSKMMAAGFQKANPGVRVSAESSGTGGGFRKFCAGQIDITGASRPINAAESQACQANHIEFIELPIAFDSLSVVVNARNTFVNCLKVDELKRMWEPAAEGKVTRWNQVRSNFPDQSLALFGPGKDSGTFDYFSLAVVGEESSSRGDYTKSEDDTVLVNGVAADPNALGYFGYAYYLANRDTLKVVAIDNGHGCVVPSPQTVADNSYEPLSRPMFVYISKSAAARPEAKAFARFCVDPEHASYVRDVGYVPLPTVTLLAAVRRLDKGTTGSIFGGRGSVLGVTAETFQDEDRIQNALVQ
jgi:phosphate transport system substrate-binding protein